MKKHRPTLIVSMKQISLVCGDNKRNIRNGRSHVRRVSSSDGFRSQSVWNPRTSVKQFWLVSLGLTKHIFSSTLCQFDKENVKKKKRLGLKLCGFMTGLNYLIKESRSFGGLHNREVSHDWWNRWRSLFVPKRDVAQMIND